MGQQGRALCAPGVVSSLPQPSALPYMLWAALGAAAACHASLIPSESNDLWIHQNTGKTSADTAAGHLSIPQQSRGCQGEKPKSGRCAHLQAELWHAWGNALMALVGWVVLGCLRLHTIIAVPWFMLLLFLFMKSNFQNVAKSFLQKDRIKVSKHRVKITLRTHLFYSLFTSSCLVKTAFLTN